MTDFNYDITRTDHYSLVNATLYGKSVQDGTPTPLEPVPIEVVKGRNLFDSPIPGYISGGANTFNQLNALTGTAGTLFVAEIPSNTTFTISVKLYTGMNRFRVSLFDDDPRSGVQFTTGHFSQLVNVSDPTSDQTYTFSSGEFTWVVLGLSTNATALNPDARAQLETGNVATSYVAFGYIELVAGDTVTPIDLQGNVLASLLDGTRDALSVDGAGQIALTKNVDHIESYNGESVGDVYLSTTGSLTTGAEIYYKASSASSIDLGYLDISHLQDIPAEIPISFVTSLTPDSNYLYENTPTYEIENPYEDYDAPEYAYPPNHFGQDWETFDANDWNKADMLDYTGQMESHAVYTVELCELMQSGAFDWSRPEIDWSEAAYDQEQFDRFCKYFEARFMFREISMLPPLHWFTAFRRIMVYELMPKYKPLYAQVESGLAPLGENEYYKERHVSSAYPETLLSGNSDYISSGEDREWERVKVDNAAEALEAYRNGFRSVDAALGDELEVLFISMYTSYVNGL